ncbi:TPA: amino acid permease [Candidatus Micrarchaeota archaeon]|nr:amino acid permease [Candidatus Micrarchaeota archaeon]
MALKRELGLLSITLYGIGIILGAGIYVLIGVGAGLAGNMLWLAFLTSAVIAIFTGLSYAELSSMFPKAAAEYNYTKKAFNFEAFSFMVGWILVVGTVIAASTVSLGFAGYFTSLFGGDKIVVAVALIAVMSLLNYIGIRSSARFNNFAAVIEAVGLLLVVFVWLLFPPQVETDFLELPSEGWAGVIGAIGVIFFAYIGFENIANLAEEVKDSRRNLPLALILSLIISTILYGLVSIAAVAEVGAPALAQSDAPLTDVVTRGLGSYASILSIIALFATGNTVLIFLIAASRILYGMAHSSSLPKKLSETGSRGTPKYSILLTAIGAAAIALSGNIKTIAQLTDLGVFIAYIAVNAALIGLAHKKIERKFTSPRVAGIPILAWLGILTSLFMLLSFGPELWLMEIVVVVVGLALFLVAKKGKTTRR